MTYFPMPLDWNDLPCNCRQCHVCSFWGLAPPVVILPKPVPVVEPDEEPAAVQPTLFPEPERISS